VDVQRIVMPLAGAKVDAPLEPIESAFGVSPESLVKEGGLSTKLNSVDACLRKLV
jgi:hypothetical protein